MKNTTRSIALGAGGVFCAVVVGIAVGSWPEIPEPSGGQVFRQGTVVAVDEELSAEQLYARAERYFSAEAYNLIAARQYYEAAIEKDQKVAEDAWYQLGRIDFLEGEYDRALWKFEQQVNHFGDQVPQVYYMLGLTYGYRARATETSADWMNAEKNFEKAMEYFSSDAWPKVDLAWVYFSQGKYEEMKPLLEKGLAEHPRNPWLMNMYGLALLNTGDREGAKLYFEEAVKEADRVTAEEWGRTYPGNNPASWELGLSEMRAAVEHNRSLVQ